MKMKFNDLLNRYIRGNATGKEKDGFDFFYESYQVKSTKWEEHKLSDKEKVRKEILFSINKSIRAENRKSYFGQISLVKLAASIVLLIALSVSVYNELKTVEPEIFREQMTMITKFGEHKTILLEDGSEIILNPGSRLEYLQPFEENSRTVYLTGEAFFSVSPDSERPFRVKTQLIETRVLGTSFNVYAYEEENIEVSVKTGKVRVSYRDKAGGHEFEHFLSPGHQIIFNPETRSFVRRDYGKLSYGNPNSSLLHFEGDRLEYVFSRLEREFGIQIISKNPELGKKSITATWEDSDLSEILDDLSFILDFTIEKKSENLYETIY